jgi:hypothetical protein
MTFGKTLTTAVVCGAMMIGAVTTALSPARAFTGEEFTAEAKITLTEARAIALKVFAGEIASAPRRDIG